MRKILILLFIAFTTVGHSETAAQSYLPKDVRPILEMQQRAAFDYFHKGAEPNSGMSYESSRGKNRKITIGGSGFGMMSIIVGAERGWITREQAADQVARMLQFLKRAERYKGAWSHWYKLDGSYGAFGDQHATGDIVESAFMVAGILAASEYFDGDNSIERSICKDAELLWSSIDWSGYTNGEDTMYWLWYSRTDSYKLKINGYNEALLPYLFGLAAPEGHNIKKSVYVNGWLKGAPRSFTPNRVQDGYSLPFGRVAYGGPLFFAHYSFLGFDPRVMSDERGDYWLQNTAHTMLNRHHCYYVAPESRGYGDGVWGLTACRGAGSSNKYAARAPHHDDGVIAPTAAIASYPYTPFYSTQALLKMNSLEGLKGDFGFGDSFNPAEGVYTTSNLAIDQGPMVVMIENYRSSLIWDLLSKNEHVIKALELAGLKRAEYAEGFPTAIVESVSGRYDMMMHPDRELYELEYVSAKRGQTTFKIIAAESGELVRSESVSSNKGVNRFCFDDENINHGSNYRVEMDGKFKLEIVLH